MEIHSSVGKLSAFKPGTTSGYEELDREYSESGFTYKSNQILHKTSESNPKHYPYELLLYISKVFHLNQFQIVFFSHILNDVQPCYNSEPDLFNEDIEISSSVNEIIQDILTRQNIRQNYSTQMEQFNIVLKSSEDVKREEQEEEYRYEDRYRTSSFTAQELKRIYSYLLVLGYAVKYYLNEQIVIKPYDQEIKMRHPTFFASIFNKWAKKYGNIALATTPRKINSYYQALATQLEVEENINNNNNEENCQYRNYNQIVEELIKATTEGEEVPDLDKQAIEE